MSDGRWPTAAGHWALAACLLAALRNPLTVMLSKQTDVMLLAGPLASVQPVTAGLLMCACWQSAAGQRELSVSDGMWLLAGTRWPIAG